MKPTILIVDDEKDTRTFMARALSLDYETLTAPDAEAALGLLQSDPNIKLMLTDVNMPGANGIELLKLAKAKFPKLAVIILTAYGSIAQTVEAMKAGADNFLEKPIDIDQLEAIVAKVLKASVLEEEVTRLRSQLDEKFGLENIVGESEPMKRVFHLIRQAAPTDATVLIQGPSGTGKELVANAIHRLSRRANGPFVAVHCAALTDTLLESELFGHEKGAFTGAVSKQIGRFEAANGGTIFLDEISEVPLATQVKLLRVLEDRTFQRVGSAATLKTDIRIVAATNRDLPAYVAEGKFREDLYYRLNVVDIHMPALKDRAGDIPLIAGRYLKEFAEKNGGRVTGIAPEAMRLLEAYPWPGNVRELRNAIEKMVVLSAGGQLTAEDVPDNIRRTTSAWTAPVACGTLVESEKVQILNALKAANGNRSRAAQMLGISRRTLYRKLDEYAAEGEKIP